MKKKFSSVILAAGESSRVGSDKLSLPLGTRSILEHTIENFSSDAVAEIIIVTGKFIPKIQKDLLSQKVRWIHNPLYEAGMSSSLKKGFESLDPSVDAVFVTPADLPLFSPQTIEQMAAMFSPQKIIIPTFQGKKGHPVLLDRAYVDQCLTEESEKVLYEVIKKNTPAVIFLPVEDEGILLDIDTMEDYETMRQNYFM